MNQKPLGRLEHRINVISSLGDYIEDPIESHKNSEEYEPDQSENVEIASAASSSSMRAISYCRRKGKEKRYPSKYPSKIYFNADLV